VPDAGAAKAAPTVLAARTNPTVDAGAPAASPRLAAAAVGGAARMAASAPPQDDVLALPTDPSSGPAQQAIQPGGVAAAMAKPHSTDGPPSEPQATAARTELSATGEKVRTEPADQSDKHSSGDAGGGGRGHGAVSDR